MAVVAVMSSTLSEWQLEIATATGRTPDMKHSKSWRIGKPISLLCRKHALTNQKRTGGTASSK